jgi:integrase
MGKRSGGGSRRKRIGRVSVYAHHGTWWIYYREAGQAVRKKIGADKGEAERVAAQVNAQLAQGAPSLLSFTPIGVPELRRQFLEHHELARGSTLATVNRYRAATQHLEKFVSQFPKPPQAHEVKPDRFAAYLRTLEVAPNGHANCAKRRLRGKGVQFILETTRSLYHFAGKCRYLPPYSENPFNELPLDRFQVEDAKPVFVFDTITEMAFLKSASRWEFPIHFTLAKTGLRIAELTHLLLEDVDLEGGWLTVRNKPELGWRVKTGHGRKVPLLPEVVAVMRAMLGDRREGVLFLREGCAKRPPKLIGNERDLINEVRSRLDAAGKPVSRKEEQRITRGVWQQAGCIPADRIRISFCRIMRRIGHPESTCPKSWRHSFATLLQDANVDPLIRQITMGHSPTSAGGLGMTARYTHSRAETLRTQIEQALRTWPESLALFSVFTQGGE